MNDKSRYVLRIVASLYIIYVGVQLISGVMKDKPENFALLAASGIFFVIAGGAILLNSIKCMRKMAKEASEAEQIANDESTFEEEDEPNERIEIKRATVADLKAQAKEWEAEAEVEKAEETQAEAETQAEEK